MNIGIVNITFRGNVSYVRNENEYLMNSGANTKNVEIAETPHI